MTPAASCPAQTSRFARSTGARSDTLRHGRGRHLHGAFLIPGTYEVEVKSGLQEVRPRRASSCRSTSARASTSRWRWAGSRRHDGGRPRRRSLRTDSSEVGTVIEERAVKRTAAQRPQLRDARLPDARRHARAGRREPLGREHLQPARRVELQRARPSGQHQRVADRRHRQQRVHVQHRDRRAVGRAGARVQGADRRLLRRVRARRRRRLGLDQVRAPTRCTARRSSTCATRRSTRENFFVRKVAPDGGLRKDPKPPLDRHQFGGAVGGALVIPGIYDGHSRTFFFADYAGLKETARPGVRQHRADRGHAHRRLQRLPRHERQPDPHLRSADDAAEPDFDPTRPVSATNPQFLRDPFPGNIIPADRIDAVGRNVASIYPLPNGPATSTTTPRPSTATCTDNVFTGRVDHRLSDNGFASSCASTTASSSSTRRRARRPAACRRRRRRRRASISARSSPASRTRASPRTARRSTTRASSRPDPRQRAARWATRKTEPLTFQSDYGTQRRESLGIHGINVSEFTTGPAQHQHPGHDRHLRRPGLPAGEPQAVPLADRGRARLAEGPASAEVRLPARRPLSVAVHQHRHARHDQLRPQLHQQPGDQQPAARGSPRCCTGYINNAARGFLLEPLHAPHAGTRHCSSRTTSSSARGSPINAGLRYEIFGAETEEDNRIVELRSRSTCGSIYAGEDGASRSVNKKTRLRATSRRGSALTYDLFGDASHDSAHRLRHHLFPEQPSASNMIGQQVPYTISQNVSFATNPTRLLDTSAPSTIRSRRSCRSSRAPRRSCRPPTRACSATRSRTRRRTRNSGTSASSAGCSHAMAVELDLCRQRGQAPGVLLQPERGPAGPRHRRNHAG